MSSQKLAKAEKSETGKKKKSQKLDQNRGVVKTGKSDQRPNCRRRLSAKIDCPGTKQAKRQNEE